MNCLMTYTGCNANDQVLLLVCSVLPSDCFDILILIQFSFHNLNVLLIPQKQKVGDVQDVKMSMNMFQSNIVVFVVSKGFYVSMACPLDYVEGRCLNRRFFFPTFLTVHWLQSIHFDLEETMV